jgi:hypothetical protein
MRLQWGNFGEMFLCRTGRSEGGGRGWRWLEHRAGGGWLFTFWRSVFMGRPRARPKSSPSISSPPCANHLAGTAAAWECWAWKGRMLVHWIKHLWYSLQVYEASPTTLMLMLRTPANASKKGQGYLRSRKSTCTFRQLSSLPVFTSGCFSSCLSRIW